MSSRRTFARVGLVLGLSFIALLMFLPIIWTVLTSFKTQPEIVEVPPSFLPDSFANFSNYSEVIERLSFFRLYLNSILFAGVVLVFSLFVASLAGYGFAKFRIPGKEVFFFLIVGVLMVPFQSVALPLYRWMDKLSLIDTFVGLSLPMLISAFGVLLMRETISTIPRDYMEAARMDGSTELGIFIRIIMPMVKPGLASLAIIKFMWTWNEFFWPLLVINTPNKAVVTLGLSYLSNMYFKEYHLITAAATLSLLPLLLLFILLRRWMVEALSGVGLKG